MFKTISILIIGIMLVSCGKKESSQSNSSTFTNMFAGDSYAKAAEIAMKNIYRSASTYYVRYGTMPSDCFEEMETRGMIEMKQNVVDSWDFQCDWEFDEGAKEITGMIVATSTDENAAGAGNQIVYDIFTDNYSGYGQGGEE